jgi:hypothetical protein
LSTIPVHGTILVKQADQVQIQPEHVALFNYYLDFAFEQNLLPHGDGFMRYCTDCCRETRHCLPLISSTPDSFFFGQQGPKITAVMDSEIFWRKLFACERSLRRGNQPGINLALQMSLENSLRIAAMVVEGRARGNGPQTEGYYLAYPKMTLLPAESVVVTGPAEHDLVIETLGGPLCICLDSRGAYFEIPAARLF